ncbi:MAG: Zn-dependent hydrolase [Chloroflexi bacterium]|nr:Zn-dependent hydrolase [Chloroflexota bacterium]
MSVLDAEPLAADVCRRRMTRRRPDVLDVRTLAIDSVELQARIDRLGEIGTDPAGGLYRALYTESWVEAMTLVREWLDEAGLVTRFDAAGNLWGRIEGRLGGDAVVTGSHIDTVRNGGKYDGALGIHMGIAAVHALLRAKGPPARPLEVLVTCEEEGSRFGCNFWGARAIVGRIDADESARVVDGEGVTVGDGMRACGLDPARIGEAERHDIGAFVEAHIEQGAMLDRERIPFGVVSSITGQRWMTVSVRGRQDHAGTTPMDLRRDAMAGAAAMIERITSAAAAMGRPAVATVGRVQAFPGGVNIVPGRCDFTVDTRHAEAGPRRELIAAIERISLEVATERGLQVGIDLISDHDPVPLSEDIRAHLMAAIDGMGLEYLLMPSGAGHDSEILAPRFPTAMLFVPSRDGRSHTPDEYTPIEQIVPGVRALAGTLYRLAYDV